MRRISIIGVVLLPSASLTGPFHKLKEKIISLIVTGYYWTINSVKYIFITFPVSKIALILEISSSFRRFCPS